MRDAFFQTLPSRDDMDTIGLGLRPPKWGLYL
jgi:hypothetical protein